MARKHLIHIGLDAKDRAIVTAIAECEGISLAEATRRIIRSCVVGEQLIVPPPPPPKKKRRSKVTATETATESTSAS